jgi:hypothetical protein
MSFRENMSDKRRWQDWASRLVRAGCALIRVVNSYTDRAPAAPAAASLAGAGGECLLHGGVLGAVLLGCWWYSCSPLRPFDWALCLLDDAPAFWRDRQPCAESCELVDALAQWARSLPWNCSARTAASYPSSMRATDAHQSCSRKLTCNTILVRSVFTKIVLQVDLCEQDWCACVALIEEGLEAAVLAEQFQGNLRRFTLHYPVLS